MGLQIYLFFRIGGEKDDENEEQRLPLFVDLSLRKLLLSNDIDKLQVLEFIEIIIKNKSNLLSENVLDQLRIKISDNLQIKYAKLNIIIKLYFKESQPQYFNEILYQIQSPDIKVQLKTLILLEQNLNSTNEVQSKDNKVLVKILLKKLKPQSKVKDENTYKLLSKIQNQSMQLLFIL